MADNVINSKLQMDGEKEYKQALDDAYRELRVLRSELKAETAELGANATAQDKARAKINSLKSQIQQQEKIVATLTKALKDSKKEYQDHPEVIDKWEEKLNKARAALAEMKNEMERSQDSLKEFSNAMEEVADDSGEAMETVLSFNDCVSSIGSIVKGVGDTLSGIFEASVNTMKSMVDEMWGLMAQAYAAAGSWKDIQSIYGGNLEEIEMMFRGANLAGVDDKSITSTMDKLIKNTHSGNKDTMAALKQMGIDEAQYTSHWDYFMAVMDELAMRKGAAGDKLASQIFGDDAGTLALLDKWQEMKNLYETDIDATGLKLYDDEIEQLASVEGKIQEIQSLWNEIKTSVGAKLSDILNIDSLADDALDILRLIGSIFSAKDEGERKELTIKLEESLTSFFTTLGESFENLGGTFQEIGENLSESDNPFVALIGRILEKLGGILDWLGEHGEQILDWIEQLLPVIATNYGLELTTGKNLGEWVDTAVDTAVDIALGAKLLSKGGKVIGEGATAGAGGGISGLAFGGIMVVPGVLFAESIAKEIKYQQEGAQAAQENKDNYEAGLEAGLDMAGDVGKYWDQFSKAVVGDDTGDTLWASLVRDLYLGYEGLQYGWDSTWVKTKKGYEDYEYTDEFISWFENLYNLLPDDFSDKFDSEMERFGKEMWVYDNYNDTRDFSGPFMMEMYTVLQNLAKGQVDKYTGDTTETKLEASVTTHTNLYLDGEQIADVVQEYMVDDFNREYP